VLPYLKRMNIIQELIQWLYLKGTSAGYFKDALTGFLGANVKSLSSNTISRSNKPGKVNVDQWAYIRNINPVECVFASV
jgi:hypothetical protein